MSNPLPDAAPLRDPAGLVDRSPELGALAQRVPSLRRAVERGRPHEAYRALFWAILRGKLGDLADTGKALLAHRRVFFRPLTGAPRMFTYNGVGTSLYGRSDFDGSDNTYVATLYAVFVFVPIFPIGSYLVRDAVGARGRRAWSFMAKVPLSTGTYLWQRVIALGILAFLGLGMANAFAGYGKGTLHVVNGLDKMVRVELPGTAPRFVLAHTNETIATSAGKKTITVKSGDLVLESGPVDVPHGGGTAAWNVLGAAPLYIAKVIYLAEGKSEPGIADETPELFCGTSYVARDGIDYVLTDPPQRISMPENSSTVNKTHMGVAPGGLETCLGWLQVHGGPAKAAALAMHVLAAEKAKASEMGDEIESMLLSAPMSESEPFAKALLARDDSVAAHRIYQNLLLASDQRARAIAEYDARLAAHPGDADAEYLALRVRTAEDEQKTVDAIVAHHPDHAFLRRAQIYVHYAAREWKDVVLASEALHRLDPALWLKGLREHVEALVALARGNDALDLAASVAEDTKQAGPDRHSAEMLEVRVAHAIGAPEPNPSQDAGDEEGVYPLFVRAVTGLEVPSDAILGVKDDVIKDALRIANAARKGPAAALALVKSADARGMAAVPEPVRVLLIVEALRGDDPKPLVTKLAGASFPTKLVDAIVAYVSTGTPSNELTEVPLELWAAIDFERSRVPGLSTKDKQAARTRAAKADVLHGPVTVAMQAWTP